jgi:hypothetical protein
MKTSNKFTVLGAAAVIAIGVTGVAAAGLANSHSMNLRLPDGAIAQIRYAGETPPEVRIQPVEFAVPAAYAEPFAEWPPFAQMQRMEAQMQRELVALETLPLLADSVAADPEGMPPLAGGAVPPGVEGYTVVMTSTPQGVCTRTIEFGGGTADRPPTVLTRASSGCGADSAGPQHSPGLQSVKSLPDRSDEGRAPAPAAGQGYLYKVSFAP